MPAAYCKEIVDLLRNLRRLEEDATKTNVVDKDKETNPETLEGETVPEMPENEIVPETPESGIEPETPEKEANKDMPAGSPWENTQQEETSERTRHGRTGNGQERRHSSSKTAG